MIKKTVASLLVAGILATGGSTLVFANPTHIENIKIQQQQIIKINNLNSALNLIQDKYLSQNADGTFSINPTANDFINNDIYNKILEMVNYTNKNILNGNLKFKKVVENGEQNFKATYVSNTYKQEVNKKIQKQVKPKISNKNIENEFFYVGSGWVYSNLYDITTTWYGGYGYVDPNAKLTFLDTCVNVLGNNATWTKIAYNAWKLGYTETVTFDGAYGIINVSV